MENKVFTAIEFDLQHVYIKGKQLEQISELLFDSHASILDQDSPPILKKKNSTSDILFLRGVSISSLFEQKLGWTSRLLGNIDVYCGMNTCKHMNQVKEPLWGCINH